MSLLKRGPSQGADMIMGMNKVTFTFNHTHLSDTFH